MWDANNKARRDRNDLAGCLAIGYGLSYQLSITTQYPQSADRCL